MNFKKSLVFIFCLSMCYSAVATSDERMVATGGSITEIMYELGLADQIIAVDSSSYYPKEVTEKPQVGYFRRLSAEGVLSLNPTHLIGSNGTGPDTAIAQITNTGVEVKVFNQEIYTLDAWKSYIREVGEYFNLSAKAELIVSRVSNKLQLLTTTNNHQSSTTAIFLMDLGDRGPVAAGHNTVPNMLFELAGFKNVVDDYEGFKPYSTERLIQIKPDVIVMPDHVVEKLGGVESICNHMMIKMTTIETGCDIVVMDALLALGFGTRIDQAVEILTSYQHGN